VIKASDGVADRRDAALTVAEHEQTGLTYLCFTRSGWALGSSLAARLSGRPGTAID